MRLLPHNQIFERPYFRHGPPKSPAKAPFQTFLAEVP